MQPMESPENPESNDNSPSVGSQTKAAYRQANSHLDTRNIDLNQLTPETLFEVACYTLTKPHKLRTEKDLAVLLKCTSNVKFFQDLVKENDPELHSQCCQRLDFHFQKAGEVVFNIGEVGKTFYIILKGSVGVWINLPQPQTDPDQPVEFALTEVRVLPAGAAFGELALMSNKPRAATIIAKEDTYFACLDKEPFDKILKDTEEKKLKQQLVFFARMKLFEGWSHSLLQKMYLQCNLVTFTRHQPIYLQGEEAAAVYFIKTGEVKLSKTIELPADPKADYVLRHNKMFRHNEVIDSRTIDLAILGANEIFGEEEVISDVKRQISVHCISQTADLYVISKKDFFRRIFFDDTAKNYLENHVKWKEELYAKRIKEILKTTYTNKEFLLRTTQIEIKPVIIYDLCEEDDPAESPSPKAAVKKNPKGRISNMGADTSKEEKIPAVFNNLGVKIPQSNELPPITNRKAQSPMTDRNLSTIQAEESARRKEDYRAIAVKRQRPRHYGEFEAESVVNRSLIVNFGIPPTLYKTNPMTLALQKQRNRDKFIASRKFAEKMAARRGSVENLTRELEKTKDPAEYSSLVRERNRAYSLGFNPFKEVDPRRKKDIHTMLDPIEQAPARTITHVPIIATDRPSPKEEKEEVEQKIEFSSLANSTLMSQKKDSVRENILNGLRKAFMMDKLRDKNLDNWIEFSRRKAQEEKTMQKGLNIGKSEPFEVMVNDPKPFHNLSSFAMSHIEKKPLADDSDSMFNKTQSMLLRQPLITQKEVIHHPRPLPESHQTSTEIQELAESYYNNRSHYNNKSYYNEGRQKMSRGHSEPSRLNLSGHGIIPTKGLKPTFGLRSLKLREYNNEVAQVRSFLETKRVGAE